MSQKRKYNKNPYVIATATDAQLYLVTGAFQGKEINTNSILRAETRLESAVNERVKGRICKADVQPMEGRWIRLIVTDNTPDLPQEERHAPFDREFEV